LSGEEKYFRPASQLLPKERGRFILNMNEGVLKVQDLSTHFRGRTTVTKAVDGISYEVMAGEIVAIVG
jgi:ABC-type uncharacterized transport system ATPase subunit